MNSKYDEELTSFIGNAEKNLIQAAEPTKCVMISEENWKSIVKTLEAQLKAMDRLGMLLDRTLTAEQIVWSTAEERITRICRTFRGLFGGRRRNRRGAIAAQEPRGGSRVCGVPE